MALKDLYGEQEAAELYRKIDIDLQCDSREREVLESYLIVYPDGINSSETTSLKIIEKYLSESPFSCFSTIHILPYYPSSSDFGFAPTQHCEVDNAAGNWDDISAIARRKTLVSDLIINHTSSSHPWFKAFLSADPQYSDFYIKVARNEDYSLASRAHSESGTAVFQGLEGDVVVVARYGEDQIDLNYRNPEVFLRMTRVADTLIKNGVDFLRLDALPFVWKEPGSVSMHLEGARLLLRALSAYLALKGVGVIPEIDIEEYGEFYLADMPDVCYGYSYATAPLLLYGCAYSDLRPVVRFFENALRLPTAGQAVRFLTTHDGILMRQYAGVLEPSEYKKIAQLAINAGGGIRKGTDEKPYELNVTLKDLFSMLENGTHRKLCAYFLLFSLPGIPAIYFNSIINVNADYHGVSEKEDFRAITRKKISESEYLSYAKESREDLDLICRLAKLRAVNSRFFEARIFEHTESYLDIRLSGKDGDMSAIINLGSQPRPLTPTHIGGVSLLGRERPYELGVFEFDWVLL